MGLRVKCCYVGNFLKIVKCWRMVRGGDLIKNVFNLFELDVFNVFFSNFWCFLIIFIKSYELDMGV